MALEYTTIPFVNYWMVREGKAGERVNGICFGGMKKSGVPDAIIYRCPITKSRKDGRPIDLNGVDYYLDFMMRILGNEGFPELSVDVIEEGKMIEYRLESKGLTYSKALLPLTWFRYPHEIPEIPAELYEQRRPRDTDERVFKRFQELHWKMSRGKLRVTSPYFGDQALANYYYDPKWEGGITIEKYVENYKSGLTLNVQSHFR